MGMLRVCDFSNCHTVTLGSYCVEHETLLRVAMAAEDSEENAVADEPITREWSALNQTATATSERPAA
jgi:hypothetical protein